MTAHPHSMTMQAFVLGSIIAHLTTADDFDDATRWVDVGCDRSRLAVFFEAEALFGVALSDDDREQVQTIGDLVKLIERRADA